MNDGHEAGERPERERYLALVVDDAPESRLWLTYILVRSGFEVIEAEDGLQAVELAVARKPDVVLLDLLLPGLDGMAALERIREVDGATPVVLVTGASDPGLAERALELGATDFIRKPIDAASLGFVVERIREALDEEVDLRPALERLCERTTSLDLGNELPPLASVVGLLGRELRLHYPRAGIALTPVKLALYEALVNAIEHGNLEIGYHEKSLALGQPRGLNALHEQRRSSEPYRSRRVHVRADYRVNQVCWQIRDHGPGFRPAEAEEALRGADARALHGRGLRLIRHAMTEVTWNAAGNEVNLTLYLPERSRASR